MGGFLAKLSVSALLFDYILTGPTSGVSAGQYLVGLVFQFLRIVHEPTLLINSASASTRRKSRDHGQGDP